MANAINDPGSRPSKHGGVVLQFQRRSQQLEGIANEVRKMVTEASALPGLPVSLNPQQIRKIDGYMEQLLIIADELNKAGK